MASGTGTVPKAEAVVKTEPGLPSVSDRILAICGEIPDGVSDKILKVSLPDIDPKARATAINALLSAGKIDLFKSETGLLYREAIQCCRECLGDVSLY